MTKTVSLKSMKLKALTWPEPLRTLILSEDDNVTFEDFIIKLGVWEHLLHLTGGEK
jgi:hypothetical protein